MLGRRDTVLTVLALACTLSVLAWLRPLGALQEDVRLDNAERLHRAIPALRENRALDSIAYKHSQEMAARRDVWHATWTQRASEPWTGYGENVGAGPTLEDVHRAFMRSYDHRRNILERYFKLLGVGVVERGGLVYVTEIYITRPFKALPSGIQPRRAPPPTRKPPQPPEAPGRLQGARHAVSMLLRLAEWY